MDVRVSLLRARVAALMREARRGQPPLDSLRALLIQAGQLEQAAEDTLPKRMAPGEAHRYTAPVCEITDQAAAAFYRAWAEDQEGTDPERPDMQAALAFIEQALGRVPRAEGVRLVVNVPEGFAFYALYPEQYGAAARRWLKDHAATEDRRALVVGIRSIGTTLSAVLAAALAAGGWRTQRLTARPTGHPFARQVAIASDPMDRSVWGLVADEGPGLSGSSMAAAAEAMVRAGLCRGRISFFPGHSGEPGPAASDAVRRWWATTARYVSSLGDVRLGGRPLPEALAATLPNLGGRAEPVVKIEDLSGGQWRRTVYPDVSLWPTVCVPFERPKYRGTTRSGTRVLFKFAGLHAAAGCATTAAETAYERMLAYAQAGWGPMPLRAAHGFVATSWIEGTPLSPARADARVLTHMGKYLAFTAGPRLSADEQEKAVSDLCRMVECNTREALGERAAEQASRAGADVARHLRTTPLPRYRDGHMAPHEWLCTPTGRLVKVDNTGHEVDHTLVGRQALPWAVAGALVEWRLDAAAARALLRALQAAGGGAIPPPVLAFYRLAYTAFRLGMCKISAEAPGLDAAEQSRLRRAYERHRNDLITLLT